jgi:acetolactate synthase-1/2/3 large subunit
MHGNGLPEVEELYKTVDAMIVVGSRLRAHETRDFTLRLPDNLIQVDIDPRANGRTYPSSIFVCGDATLTLEALAQRLQGDMKIDPSFVNDIAKTRRQAAENYRNKLGPYADFPSQLRSAMPRDTIWVRDATVGATTWGHRLMPLYGPNDSVYPVGSAIGPGLPFGIGAALAAGPSGRKTVALVGDGGFALNMSELWTAVQERAELCLIIMNDKLYTQIAQIQDAVAGGRRYYDELRGPDLLRLAEVAGLPAWRVSGADQLAATVSRALTTPGPTLIEVDMTAIGPVPALLGVTGIVPTKSPQ